MIEAILLVITIYAIVLLAFEINRAQGHPKERTLGFFSYIDKSDNVDSKNDKKE